MGGPGSGRKKGSGNNKILKASGFKKVRSGLYEYKGHSLEKVSTKQGFGFNGWLVSNNSNPRDANVYGSRKDAMKALGKR